MAKTETDPTAAGLSVFEKSVIAKLDWYAEIMAAYLDALNRISRLVGLMTFFVIGYCLLRLLYR